VKKETGSWVKFT